MHSHFVRDRLWLDVIVH